MAKVLQRLTDEEAAELLSDWQFFARPEQLAPPGEWLVWTYLAGRGAGKTRAGAEWVRQKLKAGCGRIALIGPTAADCRDVMVEGVSGMMSVCWEGDRTATGELLGRPVYEPSKRRLTWANGALAAMFSAEEPERLRGPQHDALWADELAAWDDPQSAWDMAMLGLRLGDQPQAMVTTTPKPLPIIRELVSDHRNIVTRGTTWDNRSHLAKSFFDQVVGKYEGTRLGRQELNAEILEEAEGALWSREMIRRVDAAPDLLRIVVAVDPPASSSSQSALCGIVVCGLGVDRRGYVLADYSGRMSPGQWGMKVVEAYDLWKADRIIAEGNQGGEMVRHTIQTVRENLPVTIVHASRGKQARAEPVAALYEQGKVDHVGIFPELEDELCTWEALSNLPSPDRLDALVWGLTELAIGGGPMVYAQPVEDFVCDPFRLPSSWPSVCVIDFDRSQFAAVWGVHHTSAGILYLYDQYLAPRTDLAVHAAAIRERGSWIPTLFCLAARGRSQAEGIRLAERLVDLGLDLMTVEADPEVGVSVVADYLTSQQLRVFTTMDQWLVAYRRYHRGDDGSLVAEGDHLMTASTFLALYGPNVATTENMAWMRAEDDGRHEGELFEERSTTGY